MSETIKILVQEGVDRDLVGRIRAWADEVLSRRGPGLQLPDLCVMVWRDTEEMEAFFRKEKEELGVVTGDETEFLATHDAWRGYPRIHVSEPKIKGIADGVVRGVIHHELAHALHHGTPEFYTFRFTGSLQETARIRGIDFEMLQQCVYFVSVAMKDGEVVRWLDEIGLGSGQVALLEYQLSEIDDDRRAWEMIGDSPALRKVAFAAFLKSALPVHLLGELKIEGAGSLLDKWNGGYGWLSPEIRKDLLELGKRIMECGARTFQERLEQGTTVLLTD